jgi:hypothetical protein
VAKFTIFGCKIPYNKSRRKYNKEIKNKKIYYKELLNHGNPY